METTEQEAVHELSPGSVVAGRYLVHGLLGRGGMAAVYEVEDKVSGVRCALKRLLVSPGEERRAALLTLFEREFLTLAELRHPNVVTAFDYGVDDGAPFYTMELVTGADLQARMPLPWAQACVVARDLCSVLALLHSRRLIYRDINPRNVRSGDDGSTKLIDFGAMCTMGANRQLVGTPVFCAPEAVQYQPMDGRTDLYGLGVLLYMMLTGRLPFYVRSFADVRTRQQSQAPPPSRFTPDLPSALEQLVLDLMRSDPALRPANAADVIDRLTAIAGLSSVEQVEIPRAYLSTPSLVSRSELLATVREMMAQALSRRGGSIVLRGASGSGRSRVLSACELEAKLEGVVVLHVDAVDAGTREYGAVRSIVLQLLELVPDATRALILPHASLLVHVVPELRTHLDGIEPSALTAEAIGPAVQPVLRRLLVEVSRRQALVVAVDDLERIDGESAAFLALLALELAENAIVLISALQSAAELPVQLQESLAVLVGSSRVIELEPLLPEATHLLLASVFGEVPNLQLLAHRLHTISCGNPRDLLQLAQHLVDQGVLRYHHGGWTIPADLAALELPSGMSQALHARAELLPAESRVLAQTIALASGQRFAFDECVVLANQGARGRVMQALDALLAAGVVRIEAGLFALAQHGWVAVLSSGLSAAEAQACNARLAAVFATRRDELRTAQHLLRAGETQRGLDLFVRHAAESRTRTDEDVDEFLALLRALPDDWLESYELALRLCQELGRPQADSYTLRARLCGIGSATGVNSALHFEAMIADLSRSCGLDLYQAQDPSRSPLERIGGALAAAQQRYDQSPPAERVEAPGAAIQHLARVIVQFSGLVAVGLDHGAALRMPALEPLAPLAPALRVIDQLVLGVAARVSGRAEHARAIYQRLIERLHEPDRGGLDSAHHIYTMLGVECGAGMLEAAMGVASCMERVPQLEEHRQHQVNAILMKMVYELWQGRPEEARQLKRQAELVRIQDTQRRVLEGSHLVAELTGYTTAGDLTGVKQLMEMIERQSRVYAGWIPVLHYARGEYHRLCSDPAAARVELESALALCSAGAHQIWVWAAAAHVRVLVELGEHALARTLGSAYLADAEREGLGYTANYVRMPLSLALAQLGEHAEAALHAQACIDSVVALGATGLNRVLAYETRARIAIRAGDRPAFDACLALLGSMQEGAQEGAHDSALLACHDRVVKEARSAGLLTQQEDAPQRVSDAGVDVNAARSALDTCDSLLAMTRASLELLVRSSGSMGGLLYRVTEQGPVLEAEVGTIAPSPENLDLASKFLSFELGLDQETVTEDEEEVQRGVAPTTGTSVYPIAISHAEAGSPKIVALALLRCQGTLRMSNALVIEISRALGRAGLNGVSLAG